MMYLSLLISSGAFACLLLPTLTAASADISGLSLQAQVDTATWTFWRVLATGAQAIVAAAGLIIVYLTLRQNRQALLQATRSTAVAESQTRAYVGIEESHAFPLVEGEPIAARFVVLNSGQSTAHEVTAIWGVLGRLKDEQESFPDIDQLAAEAKSQSRTILPPGGRLVINARKSEGATEESIAAIHSAKATLFFFGKISYIDVFGRRHNTHFRYSRAANRKVTHLTRCEDGNSAD